MQLALSGLPTTQVLNRLHDAGSFRRNLVAPYSSMRFRLPCALLPSMTPRSDGALMPGIIGGRILLHWKSRCLPGERCDIAQVPACSSDFFGEIDGQDWVFDTP